MAMENESFVTEFILMGLTDQFQLQLTLFFLFLVNHVVTVVGNLSFLNLICLNSHLHTPMYLSSSICPSLTSAIHLSLTPKMLMSFNSERNIISFTGCMTQLFFFSVFVGSECYVLTAMAYDCYVAICNPLLYMVTMPPQVCSLLMSGSYVMRFAGVMAHTGCMIKLTFCDFNIINHYMGDIFPLLHLSCSSTYANELVASIGVGIVVLVSSLIICISMIYVSSAKGWSKAFSTCGPHLLTVGLFYGFGLLTYVKPSSAGSSGKEKFFSVFYTNVVPMLNPLVYSLRSKDVKLPLKKILKRITNRAESVVLP